MGKLGLEEDDLVQELFGDFETKKLDAEKKKSWSERERLFEKQKRIPPKQKKKSFKKLFIDKNDNDLADELFGDLESVQNKSRLRSKGS